jgi:hypothetical protein
MFRADLIHKAALPSTMGCLSPHFLPSSPNIFHGDFFLLTARFRNVVMFVLIIWFVLSFFSMICFLIVIIFLYKFSVISAFITISITLAS